MRLSGQPKVENNKYLTRRTYLGITGSRDDHNMYVVSIE